MLADICSYTDREEENRGKGIDEVGKRQRRRKITAIKESCKKALWFLDSFNVDVTNIFLKTRKSKEVIVWDMNQQSHSCHRSKYMYLTVVSLFKHLFQHR